METEENSSFFKLKNERNIRITEIYCNLTQMPMDNFFAAETTSSPQSTFLSNLILRPVVNCFGIMACFLEWKAAPFGSRPQPMRFKMTNTDEHVTAAPQALNAVLCRSLTSH